MAVIRDVMPAFELFQPTSVDDTLGLLDRHGPDTWLMAGGMDSFDWLKDRIQRPAVVIDLGGVAELRGIKEANGGLEIGAMTTLTEIAQARGDQATSSACWRRRPMLVASPQIRNRARSAATSARTRAAGTTARAGPATAPAATSATPTRRRRSIASTRFSRRIAASRSARRTRRRR